MQAHLTAQTVLYAVANSSPALQAALLRNVVPTLEALWARTQVTCIPPSCTVVMGVRTDGGVAQGVDLFASCIHRWHLQLKS